MDEQLQKEFDDYEMMLKQWMKSDLAYALRTGGGGWEYLVEEMNEKFWDWMFPAIRRLYEAGYATNDQFKEFIGKMITHIVNFKKVLESLGEEEDNE